MRIWLKWLVLLPMAISAISQEQAKPGPGVSPYTSGSGVTPPRATYSPHPTYPELPPKKRLEGAVLLSVVIGPDGKVHEVRVVRSLGREFDEQAVKTASRWKFEPAKKDGKPVAARVIIEMNFRYH